MIMTDIRLIISSPVDIIAWLQGLPSLNDLPKAISASCLWLDARDSASISNHLIRVGPGASVVILFQFSHIPPEIIWPFLVDSRVQATSAGLPLYLILLGPNSSANYSSWQEWLTLSTPGTPPVRYCLIKGILTMLPLKYLRVLQSLRFHLKTWR